MDHTGSLLCAPVSVYIGSSQFWVPKEYSGRDAQERLEKGKSIFLNSSWLSLVGMEGTMHLLGQRSIPLTSYLEAKNAHSECQYGHQPVQNQYG